MKLSDFHTGDRVAYQTPTGAARAHGVVSAIGDRHVFVKWFKDGVLAPMEIATHPDDLVIDLTAHPIGQGE